jgi:hypothetical protein
VLDLVAGVVFVRPQVQMPWITTPGTPAPATVEYVDPWGDLTHIESVRESMGQIALAPIVEVAVPRAVLLACVHEAPFWIYSAFST